MKRRFYYICNIFEDSVKSQRNITTDSPAETGKVSRLCRAVRKAGGDAWIISLGRGRSKITWNRYAATVKRIGNVPIVYLNYWDVPVLTHLVTFVSLCVMMYRLTCRRSVLVFYNPQIHYLGALVMSRLLGRRCILDLEDGHRADVKNIRSMTNALLLTAYNACCNGGAMLASDSLKQQTRSANTFVCYGVAQAYDIKRDWSITPLQVLFGGSLLKDTGAALFLDTMKLLMQEFPEELKRLRFVVTGFGDFADNIQRLATADMRDVLSFRGSVPSQEYCKIMQQSHVGLCLKLPSSSMGATTFPSKVVELASYGLLVVSTRVSDVPFVFNEASATLLPEATPHALAQALVHISRYPDSARKTALAGQKRIVSLLSEKKIGTELLQFWQGNFS